MIAHRYKNLTSCAKEHNKIKQWKLMQKTPLNNKEFSMFSKALSWFGYLPMRWSLISKLFMPNRAPSFLRLEF